MADESVRLQLMVIDVDIAELEVEIFELKERLDWLTTDGQDPNSNRRTLKRKGSGRNGATAGTVVKLGATVRTKRGRQN